MLTLALTSAPDSRSSRTTSRWPWSAALCRAVPPYSFCAPRAHTLSLLAPLSPPCPIGTPANSRGAAATGGNQFSPPGRLQQAVATGYSHLVVDVRPGLEEQPGHLGLASVCGVVQGRVAFLGLQTRADTLSLPAPLSPSPIGQPANPRGQLQQAAAAGYTHLGVDARPGREEQPGHLELAVECGPVQGRIAALALQTRAHTLRLLAPLSHLVPLERLPTQEWRLQQAAATGYTHLGVDFRTGLEEQPDHLELAFPCGVVQGIVPADIVPADIVLHDPGPTLSVCWHHSLPLSHWNACQPERGAAAAGGSHSGPLTL